MTDVVNHILEDITILCQMTENTMVPKNNWSHVVVHFSMSFKLRKLDDPNCEELGEHLSDIMIVEGVFDLFPLFEREPFWSFLFFAHVRLFVYFGKGSHIYSSFSSLSAFLSCEFWITPICRAPCHSKLHAFETSASNVCDSAMLTNVAISSRRLFEHICTADCSVNFSKHWRLRLSILLWIHLHFHLDFGKPQPKSNQGKKNASRIIYTKKVEKKKLRVFIPYHYYFSSNQSSGMTCSRVTI